MGGTRIMMTVLIPLPLYYNAEEGKGRKRIEDEKFIMTAEEISIQFEGGGTLFLFEEGQATGFWWHKGIVGSDVQALVEADVADSPENREWFKRYACEVLKPRFQQVAIYLKFIGPVDTFVIQDETV